jgi:hypothetical protein
MGKKLNEGIVDEFIDSFFDSYKKGLDQQFINKTKERSPQLAKGLQDATEQMDDIVKYLQKLDKQNPNK